MTRTKIGVLAAVLALCLGVGAGEQEAVKAAWFRKVISCELGDCIAGYEYHDEARVKDDDLMACGLCVDDGKDKVLLVSLDLLGIDKCVLKPFRQRCAAALGVPEANVMISCTHTHEGPHSRQGTERVEGLKADYSLETDKPHLLNVPYVRRMMATVEGAVKELAEKGAWKECLLGFHSTTCDENRNRRFTTADNCASFIAHRRVLHKISTGIADKELGTVVLLDPETVDPVYVIGNYAAHPLANHAPGLGGHRISADFPGFFRRYIRRETGAEAMFVQGAAGDLVGKNDELGSEAARRTGENLAMETLASVIDVQRNRERFVFRKPRVGGEIRTFRSKMRKVWAETLGIREIELELQALALGDVCFVGVPGETVNELGLEIKWNSPYRRTFVAYCATDYFGYICPANLQAAGGYEPQDQRFASRDTLKLVATACDAMFDLRARLFPGQNADEDPYPDNLNLPLVNLPGGVKGAKWSP